MVLLLESMLELLQEQLVAQSLLDLEVGLLPQLQVQLQAAQQTQPLMLRLLQETSKNLPPQY